MSALTVWLPWLVAALVVFLLASIAHYLFWTKRLEVPMEYALEERVTTGDGGSIVIYRLPPPEGGVRDPRPVLLVHGIGIDHRNNDMFPDVSLARHLRRAGRDVWLLRLRSGGLMRGPLASQKVRFDAMAKHDLPEGVRLVLDRTAQPSLDYVGFSMGGMLAYAALGARFLPEAWIHRVVIVGSPSRVGKYVPLKPILTRIPDPLVPSLPLRLGSRMIAFAAEWVTTPAHHLFYNAANLTRGQAGSAMMTVEDIPGALNRDFLRFIRAEGVVMVEGRDVLEGLRTLRVPVLLFAGERDQLAPPETVRAAYDAWGADEREAIDKRFVLLAKSAGAGDDYGHLDLAIGRTVRTDVFEPVEQFLAS